MLKNLTTTLTTRLWLQFQAHNLESLKNGKPPRVGVSAETLQIQPAPTIDREFFCLFVCFLTCKQEDSNIVHDRRMGERRGRKKEEKCTLKSGHRIRIFFNGNSRQGFNMELINSNYKSNQYIKFLPRKHIRPLFWFTVWFPRVWVKVRVSMKV